MKSYGAVARRMSSRSTRGQAFMDPAAAEPTPPPGSTLFFVPEVRPAVFLRERAAMDSYAMSAVLCQRVSFHSQQVG